MLEGCLNIYVTVPGQTFFIYMHCIDICSCTGYICEINNYICITYIDKTKKGIYEGENEEQWNRERERERLTKKHFYEECFSGQLNGRVSHGPGCHPCSP